MQQDESCARVEGGPGGEGMEVEGQEEVGAVIQARDDWHRLTRRTV